LAAWPLLHALPRAAFAGADAPQDTLSRALPAIERRLGARLGAHIIDTHTGRQWAHRCDERFPMCSTFKVLACAAVLARVDAGVEELGRRIRFQADELVTYSPVTELHVGGAGLHLSELCEAAMTRSDNTAANLILRSLGGPAAVTAFARIRSPARVPGGRAGRYRCVLPGQSAYLCAVARPRAIHSFLAHRQLGCPA
jgi:beta-lactamase class A